jgi:UDP-N-acetylmuramate--alanine ligase
MTRFNGSFAGRRIHLIGIGGCGMCGAAAILMRSGARVSGSDLRPFKRASELIAAGAAVQIGHSPDQVHSELDLVVMSAAVPDDNVELQRASDLGTPIIKYAELLNLIMQQRCGVAVSGTHGKSTTTAMTAHIFRTGGLDPSFVVGANSRQLGGSSGVGNGPHFIVEACEYDRSFLKIHPHMAAILNIEADHLDCYRDLDEIVAAFAQFAANVPLDGLVIANHDDPRIRKALSGGQGPRIETFGVDGSLACLRGTEPAEWRARIRSADDGFYSFDILYGGFVLLSTRLGVAGRHNVSNALAAAALAFHGGVTPDRIAEALASFAGVDRRMSVRREGGRVTIVDDYAHHPTEIRATLNALRDRFGPKRTWVVFQPHQHSRTRYLMADFACSFTHADVVIVPDIYGVRDSEADRAGVRSNELVSLIHAQGKDARYLPTFDDVTEHLTENMIDGDLVVTMGAGDVWKVADELVERVRRAG